MARLQWGLSGSRLFEIGVDRGVFYRMADKVGFPWSGLGSVAEEGDGGNVEPYYFNGVKYVDLMSGEDYSATVESYFPPAEFAASDGEVPLATGLVATQQPRKPFHFSYRTLLGNDEKGTAFAYKIHLVYNITASSSTRTYKSLSNTPEPELRSWEFNAVPVELPLAKPTAHLTVRSDQITAARLTALENKLYGTSSTSPLMPTPSELVTILTS